MRRLASADVSRLLEFLRASYGTLDGHAFRAHVLAGLRRLIPCDLIAYNEVNPRTNDIVWLSDPPDALDFPDSTEIFSRHIPEHPLIAYHARTGNGRVLKLSDFLTRARLHRLGLYQEFFRRVGVEYQMACVLPARPPVVIGIALNRNRPDFSERDRSLLQLLRPHLVQAFRNACVVTQLLDRTALFSRALEDSGHGVVLLTRTGCVLWMSRQAELWMGEYFAGSARSGNGLPEPLDRWLRHQQALLVGATAPPPLRPLEMERNGARLVARLMSDSEMRLLVLEEHSDAIPLATFQGLGLTRREAEVVAWLARGKTNPEIARIAGVSARTVEKHMEHIFRKLGVENRTAAVIRALEADEQSRAVSAPQGLPDVPALATRRTSSAP